MSKILLLKVTIRKVSASRFRVDAYVKVDGIRKRFRKLFCSLAEAKSFQNMVNQ